MTALNVRELKSNYPSALWIILGSISISAGVVLILSLLPTRGTIGVGLIIIGFVVLLRIKLERELWIKERERG